MEIERCREDRSRLKQRVDELERQIMEKDKTLLRFREETALAKEEASQKTKLCVQLQKQLVDLERTNRSSSTKGSLLSGSSSSTGATSLMGALLGAASGESQIIARLEKEMAVQQEELLSKIKQNEQLQICLDDLKQNYEHDKKEFGGILEAEVKKSQKLERYLEKKSQELEVVRLQHEAMTRDLVDKDKKLFAITERLEKVETENSQLKKRIAREDTRNELLKKNNKSQEELKVETLLTIRDIADELLQKMEDSSSSFPMAERRATQNLMDYLNSLSIESFESDEKINFTVERIAKLCQSIPNLEFFVRAFDKSVDSMKFQPSLLLNELESELQLLLVSDVHPIVVDHVKRLVQMWQVCIEQQPQQHQRELQNANQVTVTRPTTKQAFDSNKDQEQPTKQEKSPALQSDESLLNGLEDMIGGRTKSTTLSTIQERSFVMTAVQEEHHPQHQTTITEDDLGFNAFKDDEKESSIKKHYHMLSLNSLRRVRQLEMEVMANESKLAALEDQILVLKTSASAAEAQRDELKKQAKRDKEELVETRLSYDSQLRSFSDRVVELEKALQEKEQEIKQVKGEGLLLQTIRKSFNQKT